MNFVIPDFLSKVEKNEAGQSWLIKLGSQIMRRTSKSMVAAQIKLPQLVEIEKIVKFSTIEERLYKNERDALKVSIENMVNSVGDEVLVRNMVGRERVLQALTVLKETLISSGEHTRNGRQKRKNINEIVVAEPINILFRMICKKKQEILEILRHVLRNSNHDSEVYWLEMDFDGASRRYEEVLKIIETIRDLNLSIGKIGGN
ncbi:unnamed protein product [Caenorhabditis angaria]|uniref:Uncharacterized protein n=1 Tax=Caenorhabditis angaria TaxID=860376 RepID=A0A9P1IS52_9PELO|nr:unnamed protein product [Caenorhabditis angaria]